MGQTFVNAPLVEIIAELHWDPTLDGKLDFSQPTIALGDVDSEKYFSDFCDTVAEQGYGRSERIFQAGTPYLLATPVIKVRKPKDQSNLFQLGVGLFTANAVQPYKSWDEFSPTVKIGVESLLKSRVDAQKDRNFTSLKLRYIDAFKENLIRGVSYSQFINEVLNVKFEIPSSLSPVPGTLKPNLQFSFKDRSGFNIKLLIADAKVNNEDALLMDTLVEASSPIKPNVDDIMRTFIEARRIIHDMFFSLTKPIHELMELKEEK